MKKSSLFWRIFWTVCGRAVKFWPNGRKKAHLVYPLQIIVGDCFFNWIQVHLPKFFYLMFFSVTLNGKSYFSWLVIVLL